MIRRTLPSTVLAVLLVSAAVAVLGRPNPMDAARFFSGGVPSLDEGEAVVSLISWVVVATIALLCIGGSVRALTQSDVVRQRSRRVTLIFVAGLLLLLVAAVHRSLPAHADVCCGDPSAAARQAAAFDR